MGRRQLSANLWVSVVGGSISVVVGRGCRWVSTWVSSLFVVAKGWGLGVAGLFMLMVVISLEGGGIGDSLWVCEFGRFYVWFEIWVTVVWCGGVLMGGK